MNESDLNVSALASLEWTASEPEIKRVFSSQFPGLLLLEYEITVHSSTNGVWQIVQHGSGQCNLSFRAWRELDPTAIIGGGTLEQAMRKAQLMQDILDLVWDE